jgi:hypothetical protein
VTECHDALDERCLMPDETPHALGILDRLDAMLTLAVVPECRRLHDRRGTDLPKRDGKLVEAVHSRTGRGRKPMQRQKRLLARALLCHVQRRTARTHGDDLRRRVGGFRWHVLEFERDHVNAFRERANGFDVFVIGHNFSVCHLAGRRVFGR